MKSPVRDAGLVTDRNGEAESPSVRLDISATSLPARKGRKTVSPFEPHSETIEARESRSRSNKVTAPEKKITLFALRLAILEKAASGLGTLAFVWATVVLLGGFAVTLRKVDFWFVSIILLTEGARIFSRSHELEWQHETTLISVATLRNDAKRLSRRFYINGNNFILRRICGCFKRKKNQNRKLNVREVNSAVENHDLLKRTWSSSKIQLVPYTGWLSISRNASQMLFWLQLVSALTCVALSLSRLARRNFGEDSGSDTKNRKASLIIFYGMSLAEALLFLLEKAYWQWTIILRKLLLQVNTEYGFSDAELPTVRRFFYDTYSQCVNGSVFDGLKMEFVSYSMDLLQSGGISDRQLTGARVLSALVNKDEFAEDTLRAIISMRDVVERLIEMLNWKNHQEQEIRRAAAEIISKLVKKDRNRVRVTAIAGSMESIASLLYDSKQIEIHSRQYGDAYNYTVFNMLGLRILKSLAIEHENCSKIGSSRGLLPKIIGLTELNTNAPESQIKTAELALELMRTLASSTGSTGKALRRGISEIVFAISNLREVLHYREVTTHGLQFLAIDTLTSLALEEEGRESIGGTGGVLRCLFSAFNMEMINITRGPGDDETRELVRKAGEALALLSLENKENCRRMMSLKLRKNRPNLIPSLISVLDDPIRGFHAARILRNLCAYSEADYVELGKITAKAAKVLKFVMEKRGEHQEAAIGLAAQIFKFITKSDSDRLFEESGGITRRSLILELVKVFGRHPRPSKEFPSIRRFSIELLIGVMEMDRVAIISSLNMEMTSELETALEAVMETTSELESYSTFSGSVGLSRHRLPISSLVESAMDLLRD
eukprot:PITA_16435